MNSGVKQNMTTIIIVLAVLISAYIGQSLIKFGLKDIGPFSEYTFSYIFSFVSKCVLSPAIVVGIIVVGIGFLGWIAVLSRLDISQALPLLAVSYVPWLIIGYFFFGEPIDFNRIVGVLLITVGVFLVSFSGTSRSDVSLDTTSVETQD